MVQEALLGVMVIARKGDSLTLFQDPETYATKSTLQTPLGGMESYDLGKFLRSEYVDGASAGLEEDLVDTRQIYARSRHGAEGNAILDSAVSVLQGLYPPTTVNSIRLANGTQVVAPLDGYQNIPVESVDPREDISLQSWTNCPEFQSHVSAFHKSAAFKKKEAESAEFLSELKPYLYGIDANLKNIWNIYDFLSTQLTHNQTYAFELPFTFAEQTRALVNFHEDGVFGAAGLDAIANIAGRTILAPTIIALERLADKHDPLRFALQETDYQPIISLMHMLQIVDKYPQFAALPNHASALAIEVRQGQDSRDYLRFRFKNGTEGADFTTVHVFEHEADIPMNEFIYRLELGRNTVPDKPTWDAVCHGRPIHGGAGTGHWFPTLLGERQPVNVAATFGSYSFILSLFVGVFFLSKIVRHYRAKRRAVPILPLWPMPPVTEVRVVEKV